MTEQDEIAARALIKEAEKLAQLMYGSVYASGTAADQLQSKIGPIDSLVAGVTTGANPPANPTDVMKERLTAPA